MKFIAVLLCLISSSVAFTGMRRVSPSSSKSLKMSSVFDDAVKKWSDTYPAMYSIGWGPTPLAERWNGRHAMFGWIALVFTGYAKSHGLIPNADVLLDTKDWGTLAYLYGGSISNERAVILVAHLHALLYSVIAAVAPLKNCDKIYLEKGETPEAAAGLIPKASPGLTRGAEMLNGRLAMLGLVVLLTNSFATQTPILDLVSKGTGGYFF